MYDPNRGWVSPRRDWDVGPLQYYEKLGGPDAPLAHDSKTYLITAVCSDYYPPRTDFRGKSVEKIGEIKEMEKVCGVMAVPHLRCEYDYKQGYTDGLWEGYMTPECGRDTYGFDHPDRLLNLPEHFSLRRSFPYLTQGVTNAQLQIVRTPSIPGPLGNRGDQS